MYVQRMYIKIFFVIGILFGPVKKIRAALPVISGSHFYEAAADTQSVLHQFEEIREAINQGRFADAKEMLRSAHAVSQQLTYDFGTRYSRVLEANIYLREQKYDSAETMLLEAVRGAENNRLLSTAHNTLGSVYRLKGEMRQAVDHFETALSYTAAEGEEYQQATIYQNLAIAHEILGDKARSLDHHLKALYLSEQVGDAALQANEALNIGVFFYKDGELDKAEYYYEKALELAKAGSLKVYTYNASLNLANIYNDRGKPEQALDIFKELLVLSNDIYPDTPQPVLMYNLGETYLKLGHLEQAEKYFEESLSVSRETGLREGELYNLMGFGRLEQKKGNLEKARDFYSAAHAIAEKTGSSVYTAESLNSLYRIYKESDMPAQALRYLEEFKSHSDSVQAAQKESELQSLKNTLELQRQADVNEMLMEKQTQQEARLRIQNALIFTGLLAIVLIAVVLVVVIKSNRDKIRVNKKLEAQRTDLERLNRELNEVFSVIAHDLRSPLTAMQNLLFIMKSGGVSEREQDEFFEHLEHSIHRNIGTMEELLTWARNQLKGVHLVRKLENIREIAEHVIAKQYDSATNKNISIFNEIDSEVTAYIDKNAVDLILRNLLTNGIKFCNPGDRITFSCSETPDKTFINLCVTDTGVGMAEDMIETLMSDEKVLITKKGTNNEPGTGFGLNLVKEFTRKLGGSFQVRSRLGHGSTFCIKLPKNYNLN